MIDPLPISKTGYNKLKEELEHLQKEELPRVMRDVAEARELGDLRENGAYIAGREQQGFIVGRIRELNGRLSRSDIIDCTKVESDLAVFGTVVSLLDLDSERKVTYQLVGPDEADISVEGISIDSPIGRALLGHAVGDKVAVETPRGERHFEVIEIATSTVA